VSTDGSRAVNGDLQKVGRAARRERVETPPMGRILISTDNRLQSSATPPNNLHIARPSMSLAERLNVPDSRKGKATRNSPNPLLALLVSYGFALQQSRPSSNLPEEGNWVHDKFAEVNDMPAAGGSLAARISSGTATGTGGAKLFQKALGSGGGGSSRASGGRVPSSGSISIKGASAPASATLEMRELLSGTTVDDVKFILKDNGEILDAWALPSNDPTTTVIRVKFAKREDMLGTCKKYDGQQADGKTLSVKEVAAPAVTKALQDIEMDSGESASKGRMYSDGIDGGITVTRPPKIDLVNDKWTRGGRGGGRARGRGGRGRGRGDKMQVD